MRGYSGAIWWQEKAVEKCSCGQEKVHKIHTFPSAHIKVPLCCTLRENLGVGEESGSNGDALAVRKVP